MMKQKKPSRSRVRKELYIIFMFLVFSLWSIVYGLSDTIYTKDNKELKGIVLEDYKDRIVFSTVDGEMTIMKDDIKELYYDTEEQNLIKLGEQSKDKGDYIKSFIYYDKAYRLNPNSKQAKDGIVFLQGYLFKKDMAQKEEVVRRHNEFEQRGERSEIKSDEEKFIDSVKRLKESSGITLLAEGGVIRIEHVAAGSPAHDAGIKKGDILIDIWGRLVGYMSLPEAVDMLLEKTSLETKCTIERNINLKINENRNILSNTNDLIGAAFNMQIEGLTTSAVAEGSPAIKAGLKEGDVVVKINNDITRYMPLKRAIEAIKKSKGDTVNLTIRRSVVIWGKGGQ